MRTVAAAGTRVRLSFRAVCAVLVLAALVGVSGCRRDQIASGVEDFTLPQVRGGVFRLRSGDSRPVLLAFLQTVPDTADTPSRGQVGFLLSMNHQYGGRGLKVVVIDASAVVTRMAPGHDALVNASYDWHLDVPMLEDDGNRVAKGYGITRVPTLILLSGDGRVARRWDGLTGPAELAREIERVVVASGR